MDRLKGLIPRKKTAEASATPHDAAAHNAASATPGTVMAGADSASPPVPGAPQTTPAEATPAPKLPRPNLFLLRTLAVFSAVVVAILGGASYWLWKQHSQASHSEVADAHAKDSGQGDHEVVVVDGAEVASDEEGEHGHEAKELDPLGLYKDIPRSIVQRQDGVPEDGHDLVDPEIEGSRGLASILKDAASAKEAVEVRMPYRFVVLEEIFGASRAGTEDTANVIAEIGLEVSNLDAQKEVLAHQVELRSAVASLISEQTGSSLKTFEGKAKLKKKIMDEINHRIVQGRVTDVLFQTFIVR